MVVAIADDGEESVTVEFKFRSGNASTDHHVAAATAHVGKTPTYRSSEVQVQTTGLRLWLSQHVVLSLVLMEDVMKW